MLSIKPAAAAAQPEYELSIDTTTGISAPPIDETKCQPNARAIAVIINTGKILSGLFKNDTIKKAEITNAARFNLCLCGRFNAAEFTLRPNNLPLNLPNATNEPEKVTAPIKIPKNTSTL